MRSYHILGFVVLVISISSWHMTNCQRQPHRQLRFANAANCDVKGLKLLMENLYTQYYPPRNFLNARYRVIDHINEMKKVLIHIEKCHDQANDCEDFQNLRIERCCRMITLKNQIWSDFIDHFHPPFRCPLKKITYDVQNATVDSDALMRWFPDLDKYRWKVTFRVTNEHDDVVSCVIFDAYVDQFRKERKPSKRPENR